MPRGQRHRATGGTRRCKRQSGRGRGLLQSKHHLVAQAHRRLDRSGFPLDGLRAAGQGRRALPLVGRRRRIAPRRRPGRRLPRGARGGSRRPLRKLHGRDQMRRSEVFLAQHRRDPAPRDVADPPVEIDVQRIHHELDRPRVAEPHRRSVQERRCARPRQAGLDPRARGSRALERDLLVAAEAFEALIDRRGLEVALVEIGRQIDRRALENSRIVGAEKAAADRPVARERTQPDQARDARGGSRRHLEREGLVEHRGAVAAHGEAHRHARANRTGRREGVTGDQHVGPRAEGGEIAGRTQPRRVLLLVAGDWLRRDRSHHAIGHQGEGGLDDRGQERAPAPTPDERRPRRAVRSGDRDRPLLSLLFCHRVILVFLPVHPGAARRSRLSTSTASNPS